jgi:hypothetical protein
VLFRPFDRWPSCSRVIFWPHVPIRTAKLSDNASKKHKGSKSFLSFHTGHLKNNERKAKNKAEGHLASPTVASKHKVQAYSSIPWADPVSLQ